MVRNRLNFVATFVFESSSSAIGCTMSVERIVDIFCALPHMFYLSVLSE